MYTTFSNIDYCRGDVAYTIQLKCPNCFCRDYRSKQNPTLEVALQGSGSEISINVSNQQQSTAYTLPISIELCHLNGWIGLVYFYFISIFLSVPWVGNHDHEVCIWIHASCMVHGVKHFNQELTFCFCVVYFKSIKNFIGEEKLKTFINFCLKYIADLDIPVKRYMYIVCLTVLSLLI